MFSKQKHKCSHLAKSLSIFKFHLFFMSTKTKKSISQTTISVSYLLNCYEKTDFQLPSSKTVKVRKSSVFPCLDMHMLQELGVQSQLFSTIMNIFSVLYLVYTFCFQDAMTNTAKTPTLQKVKMDMLVCGLLDLINRFCVRKFSYYER